MKRKKKEDKAKEESEAKKEATSEEIKVTTSSLKAKAKG